MYGQDRGQGYYGSTNDPDISGHGFRPPSTSSSFSERPLFGDRPQPRSRLLWYVLLAACGVLMLATVIALAIKFDGVNLLAVLVIGSFAAAHGLLFHWYRKGDLDPKFRKLLLWNSVNVCLLCTVSLLFYFTKSSKNEFKLD